MMQPPCKPMVPTAHAWFNEHPIDPLRRHMGRPFGSGLYEGRCEYVRVE